MQIKFIYQPLILKLLIISFPHSLLLLIPIPIAITIPGLAVAVAILLAIAIAVAVLALGHVDAVDDRREVRNLMLVAQRVDEAEATLRRIVCTTDIDQHVCHTGDDRAVGHHADGSSVEDDVVVLLLQTGDRLVERTAGYQLGGIGRNGTTGEDVKVRTEVRLLDDVEEVRMLGVAQVTRDAVDAAREVEHLVQSRLADVHTHDERLLAHVGETHGKVACHERFSFTGHRRREHDDALLRLQHEQQVRTQGTEGLLHHLVAVLVHDDGTRRGLLAQGDFADNGYIGELLHIRAVLYLVLQQVRQVDAAEGYAQTQHEGCQVEQLLLRRHRILVRQRLLDDASVVRSGCQRDGVLLALLEEHGVERRLDFLLTRDAHELLLLLGGTADASLKLACLAVEVLLGNLQSAEHTLHGGLHTEVHGCQIGVELHHCRVLFRRGEQEALALGKLRVILVDGGAQHTVLQTDVARDDLVLVGRIVDVVAQETHEADLCLVLHALLLVLRVLLQDELCIAHQVGQPGALLEGGKPAFGRAQFLVDDAQTLLDELCRLLRHLVLLIVGILVVECHQAGDEVHGTQAVGVLHGKPGDGRGLRRGLHGEVFPVRLCHGYRRVDDGIQLHVVLHGDGVIEHERHDACRGVHHGRELVKVLLHRFLVRIGIHRIDRLNGEVLVCRQVHLQLHGCIELVGFRRGHVDLDGRLLVQGDGMAEGTRTRDGGVEVERGHYLLEEGTRTENLHLVVEVVCHGEHTQVLHGCQRTGCGIVAALVLLLDEHGRLHVVDGCLIAQPEPRTDEHHHHTGNKPVPVDEVLEKDFIEVDVLFFMFLLGNLFHYLFSCLGFVRETGRPFFYLNMFTIRLAMDTRMDVAEMTVVVVLPMSEFFALVLFGVT